MKKNLVVIMGAAILAMAMGCATNVQYGDPTSASTISTGFGSSDLQQIANSMVDSLLSFPPIVEVTAQRRPVLTVDSVKNKTMQHIDTESITDSIRTKLMRSGKFRFIDRTTDRAALEEIQTQQDGGMTDPSTAVPMGQQLGAEYMLTANLSEIRQEGGRIQDTYYKFTMNLKNLRTGILEWSDEKEIRKTSKNQWLGL